MNFRDPVISRYLRAVLLFFSWALLVLSLFLSSAPVRIAVRLVSLAVLILVPKKEASVPARGKDRIAGICVFVLIAAVSVASMSSIVVAMSRPTPLRVPPPVDAQVIPGGDRVTVRPASEGRAITFRSCFYADGFAVCAAHSGNFGQAGAGWLLAPGGLDEAMVDGSPRMEANTSAGVVLSGVKCPDDDRPSMPIANASQIRVGESAIALASPGDPTDLEILGFLELRGVQYLLARGPKHALAQGDSGAPVIQEGKVIGFFTMVLRSDRSLKFLRLASEVFSETMEVAGD